MQTRIMCPSDRGFTLIELLVVTGLVTVLISLLLPAVGNARRAAYATTCSSNLRQMAIAWTMYLSENRGRLPEYMWSANPPLTPDTVWRGYWLGILDNYRVRGETILCPAAREPIPFNNSPIRGMGNVGYAWSGRWDSGFNPIHFNNGTYRDGSYGYNKNLTPQYLGPPRGTRINAIKPPSDVPVFFDCVYPDAQPSNLSDTGDSKAPPPPNLQGSGWPLSAATQSHWRFLIARHGRAINVAFADGSARRVLLEDTYLLTWNIGWVKYRLDLPIR